MVSKELIENERELADIVENIRDKGIAHSSYISDPGQALLLDKAKIAIRGYDTLLGRLSKLERLVDDLKEMLDKLS